MTKGGPLAGRVEELQSRIDRAKAALAGIEKSLGDATAVHRKAAAAAEALADAPKIAREIAEGLGAKLSFAQGA